MYLFIYLLEFGAFSQNRHKGQLKTNRSEHVSKEVKELLQKMGGEAGVAMEFLKKTKWAISKILL